MRVALQERGYLIWALMSAEEFSEEGARADLDIQLFQMPLTEHLLYAMALGSSPTPQTRKEGGWL